MRLLVIGAGPAGTRCAVRLAERLPASAVTLAGAEAALPYDRVALSKLLAGDATMEGLITHPLALLRGLGIVYRPATPIAAIDRAASEAVTTRGERLGYDRLVLATGSSAIRLPLPGPRCREWCSTGTWTTCGRCCGPRPAAARRSSSAAGCWGWRRRSGWPRGG
ncbi:FAD-dependent oxidoreductase [Paeniroseomonas aquatica]|uniref:FAD-dependent oxidoreductase n=1 Tax=Paeniroseomonas aquatica TaxID=373043 RepID=UPI003608B820